MMVKGAVKTVLFIIILSSVFVSCDILLPSPLIRNNPNDNEAQLGEFAVVASGDSSVLALWDWQPASPLIPDDRIIDKIRIVHRVGDPPVSMYTLNKDDYTEITDSSSWQFEWKDLKQSRDHYFALYAHEKGGTWLAPIHEKIWLDYNNGWIEYMDLPFTKLYVNTSSSTNTVFIPTSAEFVHRTPDITIFFLVFDSSSGDEYGAILDARLTDFSINNTGTVDIVPMKREVHDGMLWENISDPSFYDYTKSINVYIGSGTDEIQIRDQMNAARLNGSYAVAFIPDEGSPIDVGVDSSKFNNGSEDLFGIWRNY